MMEPRLEELVKLWHGSLEGELSTEAAARFEALLQDGALVEQFGDWQAARSAAEGLEAGETPALDQRVLQGYHRGRLFAKAWPWAVGAIVGAGALLLGLAVLWPKDRAVARVQSEEEIFEVRELRPEARPTARPTLGLPPGYGSRPSKLDLKVGRNVDLRWTQPEDGPAAVKVLGDDGRLVRLLWRGRAEAGRYTNTWNGKDDHGKLVGPGRYRLVAEGEDGTLASRRVVLSPSQP